MFHSRALFVFASLALIALVPACGDSGTGGTGNSHVGGSADGGEGGNPSTVSTGGDGGSTTISTGGNPNVCTPTIVDVTCSGADTCACEPMGVSMPPEAACPSTAGNVCEPGHNQCGCDLPMGTDYVPPDPTCIGYVNGDTWGVEGTAFSDPLDWSAAPNGQTIVGFGSLFGPDAPYYKGMIMSGKSLYWNRANQMLENCSGEFSPDCKRISINCVDGSGATTVDGALVYLHE